LDSLDNVPKYSVPRCYSLGFSKAQNIQVHLFSDASEVAFCCAAYLRIVNIEGNVEIKFLAGKSTRLELQGAVMASRMGETLRKELSLPTNEVHYWTDSRTVLGWIRSDHRRYSQFVAHRVSETLDVTTINQWHWVPTKLNVADDGTKWEEIPVISDRWLQGPKFLLTEGSDWPQETVITKKIYFFIFRFNI
jgi:hypothetical protein